MREIRSGLFMPLIFSASANNTKEGNTPAKIQKK